MKTLLRSNKGELILLGMMAVLIILFNFLPRMDNPNGVYHISQWNEYAPEVERAITQSGGEDSFKLIDLDHISGMVLPHHIPTTIPRLVEYYGRLKKTQVVNNFVVIGPDHTDAGKNNITTSDASFITTYGELRPIDGLAEKLVKLQLAAIEEAPFDPEHSIGTQALVISRLFPGSHITPIIIKSHTTTAEAQALGKALADITDKDTVIVASVDFSHYLSTEQARPIDAISGEVIKNLNIDALSLVKADSGKSMQVFVTAMNEKKAIDTEGYQVLNTNNLVSNSDYTTGYIFGFWGKK